jgi:CHAD domain-containing protein
MVDQQQEREDKYDVGAGWRLPDLADLLPEGGRSETDEFRLVNTYYDTPSAHLARLGVTLRRREGGPDAGWHLKVPAGLARNEITDSSDSSTLPDALASVVTGLRAGEELEPTASLTVIRSVHRLVTEDGAVTAEVAEDSVSAATMGDASRLSSWREVEVELKPAGDERLLKAIGKRLRAAGADRSASASKIRRALGPDQAPSEVRPKSGTVGALVVDYLAEQVQEFVRCDLALRLGEPEVHKFRVALRRLRSTLLVFGPVFDAEQVAQLEPELVWLAGLLGEVRDRDVLRERLAAQVAELPEEMVLGPVAAHIETTLLLERSDRLSLVTEAMDGERYAALVRQIMAWQASPPLTKLARKPASSAGSYVEKAERKVRKRLAKANGEVEALHGARKAAKRYRYAAELAAPALGRAAKRTVKSTTELQTQLGEHQDSVVSAAFLRRLGAEAGVGTGQNGFTYGLLLAMEWQRAEQVSRHAGRRWGKKH